MKTFCFKLYNSEHNSKLMRLINIACLIYNHCVALHRRYYRLFGKYITANRLKTHLTKLKRTERFAYIRHLDAQGAQDIVERIDRAYNLFWSSLKRKVKCSPPKFRKVRRYKSFTLKQTGWKLDEECGKIRIGKKWYRYFQSRRIDGKVKTVTIKRDSVGDIYVYLVCHVQSKGIESRTGKSIGFDFGLKKFLTGSDGHDIESPYFFMQNVKAIRKKSCQLSRKQKGSRNWERALIDLARTYRRLENQRRDFHYKTARNLCEEYACICLETLNIKGMARRWGRKIHSLGFYSFVKILVCEAAKFGTQIIFVPMFYPSSQLCSVCGYKNPEVKNLNVREWDCLVCGSHHDRDRNAAINIHRAGASALSGGTVRPERSGGAVEAKIPRPYVWGVCQNAKS